jgi:hypothetical protein
MSLQEAVSWVLQILYIRCFRISIDIFELLLDLLDISYVNVVLTLFWSSIDAKVCWYR